MKTKTVLTVLGLIFLCQACGQEVKMVVVEPKSIKFTMPEKSQTLESTALDMASKEVPGVTFTYTSDNPSVASVDSNGKIKPVGNGSAGIIVKTPTGVLGEAFVKVCLPKEIICDPATELKVRVGTAAPIKCYTVDCKDEKLPGAVTLKPTDPKMLLMDGDNTFIGLAVGDTTVKITGLGLEQTVKVRVDEQIFAPGMGPANLGGSKKHKGGGGGDDDAYSSGGGRFDHIVDKMKFN